MINRKKAIGRLINSENKCWEESWKPLEKSEIFPGSKKVTGNPSKLIPPVFWSFLQLILTLTPS